MPHKVRPLANRFWEKVQRGSDNECWLWMGSTFKGYGHLSLKWKVKKKATHVAFFLAHGRWPELDILHSCDNPRCVNPRHLSEGTHARNMREAADRGLLPQGERRNFAKLKNADIPKIRELIAQGHKIEDVSKAFAVSFQTIWRIREGITWKGF